MAIKEKSDRLGTKKAVYLASVGTLLLSAIMVMLPVISASFGSMSESATLFYSVDGPESLNTVLMLMLLGATALGALDLYTTKEFSKAHLIFGFVMRVIVLFLLIICKAYNDDKASFLRVEIGFTFAGWLLLLCCVGGFVLDIMSMGAFKRSKHAAMGLT